MRRLIDLYVMRDGYGITSWFLLEMAVPTYDENLFDWESSPANVIDCKFSSAATLRSTLQAAGYAEAEIHFSNSSALQINIEGLETACVKDTRQISKLVKGHLWKPILEDVKMDNQTCTQALLGRYVSIDHACNVTFSQAEG